MQKGQKKSKATVATKNAANTETNVVETTSAVVEEISNPTTSEELIDIVTVAKPGSKEYSNAAVVAFCEENAREIGLMTAMTRNFCTQLCGSQTDYATEIGKLIDFAIVHGFKKDDRVGQVRKEESDAKLGKFIDNFAIPLIQSCGDDYECDFMVMTHKDADILEDKIKKIVNKGREIKFSQQLQSTLSRARVIVQVLKDKAFKQAVYEMHSARGYFVAH